MYCVLSASLAAVGGAGDAVAQEFPVRGRVTAAEGIALEVGRNANAVLNVRRFPEC